MSDTKETGDKTLRTAPAAPPAGAPAAGGRKTLTLTRTVEQGAVRQNFGQGRSKSVQVEVKKTRKLAKPGSPGDDERADQAGGATVSKLGGLSNSEMDKRLKALEASKERDEDEARERAQADEQKRVADATEAAERAAKAKAEAAERAAFAAANGMAAPIEPPAETVPEPTPVPAVAPIDP